MNLSSRFHDARSSVRRSIAVGFNSRFGRPSNSTTAPSPPGQQPPPAVSFVNMAGSGSGTLESSTHQTRTITMTVVQGRELRGWCVDDTQDHWMGAISGYAAADSFSGEISIATVNDLGERCTGVGTTSGPVDAEAAG